MFKQENAALLRRARRAEQKGAQALADRTQAEQDALSANAEAIEAGQKVQRLSAHVARLLRASAHVARLLRASAHDVHVSFQPTRSYTINRVKPQHIAAARCPEAN